MVSYELTFIVAVAGISLFIALALISPNYKFTILAGVASLVVFTYVIASHIEKLEAGVWTLWDLLIVVAICFVVIWITPDIMKFVRQWRGRNQK